jgi:TRAP-type C4-dicarboxylate transport system permease small subunit
MSTSGDTQKGIGELITSVIADIQKIIRQQIDLAVAETKDSAKAALRASVLVITAITLFLVASLMVVVALGFGLAALGLPYWAAFLLDALIFILIGLLLLFIASRNAKKVKLPTQSMDNLETSVNQITESITRSKLID